MYILMSYLNMTIFLYQYETYKYIFIYIHIHSSCEQEFDVTFGPLLGTGLSISFGGCQSNIQSETQTSTWTLGCRP